MPLAIMQAPPLQAAMQPPMQAPMQPAAMKFTTMPSVVSRSVMTARPNQLGFISAPLIEYSGHSVSGLIYALIYV